jgi:hypothetical protein
MTTIIPKNAIVIAAARAGIVVLPDNEQWTNRVEIKSETSSRLYTVAQNKKTGQWGCSCPGWKRHRHCKHLGVFVPTVQRIAGGTNV